MIKACSAEQMRSIDRAASEIGGVSGIVLMENAGLACVRRIEAIGTEKKRIAVFCGKGNNGGDGFVIARHLLNSDVETEVFLTCGRGFSGDALANYEILNKMGAVIHEVLEEEDLKYKILSFDIVVDAIFGTGISGEVSGSARTAIKAINKYAKFVLSVDIPSGVNADDGSIAGVAVRADMTVTFCAYKIGMLSFPGADYTGRVEVADISIPRYIYEDISTNIIDRELAASVMPKRADNSHKGDYGKLLIIGGATGMTGAPAMSAEAAIKCGCGLVSVAVPESLNEIMEIKLTEAMTIPMPENRGELSYLALSEILKKAQGCDAVVFGPGIGRGADIQRLLAGILENTDIPVLIDADGLYALAGDLGVLENCAGRVVLTPHEAEFARLLGCDIDEVSKNRLKLSAEFCSRYGVALVLKGSKTIVTTPDLKQYISIVGNNGMATGGSGDVLSGMVGAYLARGLTGSEAAMLGVYCHGLAGDRAAELVGKESLCATDIISAIHLILPVE